MPRETKVVAAVGASGELMLLTSLSTRLDTQLILVDSSSGELVHQGIPGQDLFTTEKEALDVINLRGSGKRLKDQEFSVESPTLVRGSAFLGFVAAPPHVMVLVAAEVRRDPLPANNKVCTVTQATWVKGLLPSASGRLAKREDEALEKLREFAINNLHFYSETCDLTRPFPSTESVLSYDPEYCWNQWLSAPFERAGLRSCCVVLLQGLACARTVRCGQSSAISIALISKKSIANPGTRYNARGLNSIAGAGNEVESEQIVWTSDGLEGQGASAEAEVTERWISSLWRRGTVPVHWRHELHSSVTAPKVVIPDQPYEGVEDFFSNIHQRYQGRKMVFVNLLRCDTESGETGLSEVFQQSLREARTRLQRNQGLSLELNMCNFDWHRLKKELGMPMAVKGLWERLTPLIEESDLTVGSLKYKHSGSGAERLLSQCAMEVERKQQIILRYNCADSLDRTNLCCFMVSQQLLLEQCRRLGVGIMDSAAVMLLPQDGRDKLWTNLHHLNLDDVRSVLHPKVLEWLAEAYVRNGDVMSLLYTNTQALFTNVIREYTSLPPAQSDTQLTVQRRYENVLNDAERQRQYFLFLGRYLKTLLPGQSGKKSSCQSFPGAYSTQKVLSLTEPSDLDFQVLDTRTFPGALLVPQDEEVVDICLSLKEPCVVTDVQLLTKGGSKMACSPGVISIWVGEYRDRLTQVYGNVSMPKCDDGSLLSYPIPSTIETRELSGNQMVPELKTKQGASPILSRVVQIQLIRTPASEHAIILGKIVVNGVSPVDAVVSDSGVNRLADSKGDDELAILQNTTSAMVEKKVAEGARQTVRDFGGKALAKADELVGKYAGDDTKKVAEFAKGAFSKFSSWMSGGSKPSRAAVQRPVHEQPQKPSNWLGKPATASAGSALPDSSAVDVAGQLAAMWKNQGKEQAWSGATAVPATSKSPPAESGIYVAQPASQPSPASGVSHNTTHAVAPAVAVRGDAAPDWMVGSGNFPNTPSINPTQRPSMLSQATPTVPAPTTAGAVSIAYGKSNATTTEQTEQSSAAGSMDVSAMEKDIMAQARGMRNASSSASTGPDESNGTESKSGSEPIDPLGGFMIGGSNFGSEDPASSGPSELETTAASDADPLTALEQANDQGLQEGSTDVEAVLLEQHKPRPEVCKDKFQQTVAELKKQSASGTGNNQSNSTRSRELLLGFLAARTLQSVVQSYEEANSHRSSGVPEHMSLAEYPGASVLMSVPTNDGQSLPIESILMPHSLLPLEVGDWQAPAGVREVSIPIVLSSRARITEIELIQGTKALQKGKDAPVLDMCLLEYPSSNPIENWFWDTGSAFEGGAEAGTAISFFPPPGRGTLEGRLLVIKASLPEGGEGPLRLCRIRVTGTPSTAIFDPPRLLMDSVECNEKGTLQNFLQSREELTQLRSSVLNIRNVASGNPGQVVDLGLDTDALVAGFSIEMKHSSPGGQVAELIFRIWDRKREPAQSTQPAGADELQVKSSVSCRLPLVRSETVLYYPLPNPCSGGMATVTLVYKYSAEPCDAKTAAATRILLYGRHPK